LEQFCERRFDSREHYCRQFLIEPFVTKTCEERGMREERGGTKEEKEKQGRERRKKKKKRERREGLLIVS
jgi:hypothetical protein